MTYWDTSALIKLYVLEPDSSYFLNLLEEAQQPPISADIARAEVLCTLYRKEQAGDLRTGAATKLFTQFLSDIASGRLVLVPNGDDVTSKAHTLVQKAYTQPQPVLIRSLDALHVASALAAKATTLVATDTRLRTVAVMMELAVLP